MPKRITTLFLLIFISGCDNYSDRNECVFEKTKECKTNICANAAKSWCESEDRKWIQEERLNRQTSICLGIKEEVNSICELSSTLMLDEQRASCITADHSYAALKCEELVGEKLREGNSK